jgi:hypothetical protein
VGGKPRAARVATHNAQVLRPRRAVSKAGRFSAAQVICFKSTLASVPYETCVFLAKLPNGTTKHRNEVSYDTYHMPNVSVCQGLLGAGDGAACPEERQICLSLVSESRRGFLCWKYYRGTLIRLEKIHKCATEEIKRTSKSTPSRQRPTVYFGVPRWAMDKPRTFDSSPQQNNNRNNVSEQ